MLQSSSSQPHLRSCPMLCISPSCALCPPQCLEASFPNELTSFHFQSILKLVLQPLQHSQKSPDMFLWSFIVPAQFLPLLQRFFAFHVPFAKKHFVTSTNTFYSWLVWSLINTPPLPHPKFAHLPSTVLVITPPLLPSRICTFASSSAVSSLPPFGHICAPSPTLSWPWLHLDHMAAPQQQTTLSLPSKMHTHGLFSRTVLLFNSSPIPLPPSDLEDKPTSSSSRRCYCSATPPSKRNITCLF